MDSSPHIAPVVRASVLVGRAAELGVRRLVYAIARGDGAALLVTGEAGSSNSRDQLASAVRASGITQVDGDIAHRWARLVLADHPTERDHQA